MNRKRSDSRKKQNKLAQQRFRANTDRTPLHVYLPEGTLGALQAFQLCHGNRGRPHTYADIIATALAVLARQDVDTLESVDNIHKSFYERGFGVLRAHNVDLRASRRALVARLAGELETSRAEIRKEYELHSENLDDFYNGDKSEEDERERELRDAFIETALELMQDSAPELVRELRRRFPSGMFKPWQRG